MTKGECAAVELEWIPLAAPWEALLLPVRDFPLGAGEKAVESRVWGWFRREWIEKRALSSEVILHITRLGRDGSMRLREDRKSVV